MAPRQKYWDSKIKDFSKEELNHLDDFIKNFNIPKNKISNLKEAFYRAKNSFLEFNIDLNKLEEPTKTMVFESVVYIWYIEGNTTRGKKIISHSLSEFKKDNKFYSFKSAINIKYTKGELEKMLDKNEDRYNNLSSIKLGKMKVKRGTQPLGISLNIDDKIKNKSFGKILITAEQGQKISEYLISNNIDTPLEKKPDKRRENFEKWLEKEYKLFIKNLKEENKKQDLNLEVDFEVFRQYTIFYLSNIQRIISNNKEEKQKMEYMKWLYSEFGQFIANSDTKNRTLSFEAFNQGITAYINALNKNDIKKRSIFTILDFSLPSTEKRMYVLDMESKTIQEVLYVSYGYGNEKRGKNTSVFSNNDGTYAAGIGLVITLFETVICSGTLPALTLEGKEKGFNDNTQIRGITLHGAEYARKPRTYPNGEYKLGLTAGCFAVDDRISARVIDEIKGGSAIFVYGKFAEYNSETSKYQDIKFAYNYIKKNNI